jgi:hypothetical protein
MVIFDATALLLLIAPQAAAPRDSKGQQITYAKERIDGEIQALSKSKQKIVVPTPALSEALVRAGAAAAKEYLRAISRSPHFKIAPFDEKAAIELALMTQSAIKAGNKKGGSDETWAKVKFDRQIVAIARVNGAGVIYTDDRNLRTFAFAHGLSTISVADLPIPAASAQTEMELEGQPSPAALKEEQSPDVVEADEQAS